AFARAYRVPSRADSPRFGYARRAANGCGGTGEPLASVGITQPSGHARPQRLVSRTAHHEPEMSGGEGDIARLCASHMLDERGAVLHEPVMLGADVEDRTANVGERHAPAGDLQPTSSQVRMLPGISELAEESARERHVAVEPAVEDALNRGIERACELGLPQFLREICRSIEWVRYARVHRGSDPPGRNMA